MDKKALVEGAVESLRNVNRVLLTRKANRRRFAMLEACGIPCVDLTKEQKDSVRSIWGAIGAPFSYDTHRLVLSVTGQFDPQVVPEDLYRTRIDPALCEYDAKYLLSDKNYFETYMPQLKYPDTVIRCVRGQYYDSLFRPISQSDALKTILQRDKVVIKPSNDSGFGRGVELVIPDENTLLGRGEDFIVQGVLKQHESLSLLNESSVNIVRIVTLFINGQARVITSALRVGGVGDFTDNVEHSDGSGMIVVGIDDQGRLKADGYHSNGTRVKSTPGGVLLKGYELPRFHEMGQLAIQACSKYPMVRFIGWDFTLDVNGDIVVMEYNTKSPGVLYYQYTNGPLFGSSTQEVIDYVRRP